MFYGTSRGSLLPTPENFVKTPQGFSKFSIAQIGLGAVVAVSLATGATYALGSYVQTREIERCVADGMRYQLSKEESPFRDNFTLQQVYFSGRLPSPEIGVIPLELEQQALQRGQEARKLVTTQCREDSGCYR